MRIFLVRHGMSRSNVDWSENRRVADHAIELTQEGKQQAEGAGKALAKYFEDRLTKFELDHLTGPVWAIIPRIRIWNSPYLRTRQTRDHLMRTCVLRDLSKVSQSIGSDFYWSREGAKYLGNSIALEGDELFRKVLLNPGDSWFTDQREDITLHEQQFGIFDGLSDEERAEQYPAETAYYEKCKQFEGKVWAKFPVGESRIDVLSRMHKMSGTIKRDQERHNIQNVVIVGHGTTNRCFTCSWLHLPFEWLEKEPNPRNCSIRLIEDGKDMGYVFEGYDNPPGYKHVTNKEAEE